MNAPDANTTRASLEVARVALGRMMGAPAAPGASRGAPMTMATRASEAWGASEMLLRVLTGRADLAGQALLAEARRVDALDMEGMHALVAMREWVERTLIPGSAAQMLTLPPTDSERDVAAKALAALERAVNGETSVTPLGTPVAPANEGASSQSQWAPRAPDRVPEAPVAPPKANAWAPQPTPVSLPKRDVPPPNVGNAYSDDPPTGATKRSISSGMIMALLLFVVVCAGVGAFLYSRKNAGSSAGDPSSPTEQGVAAYARGSKEAARLAFVKAIEKDPDNARALTYLGRISRELGSTSTARQYLERAIRVDPNNALASRELGSALLADQEYELARRFYVRALTLDPNDRIAQGFLGCALFKLNRTEEAQRWINRAGAGEWTGCAQAPAAPPAK